MKKSQRSLRMKITVWADFVCPFCYVGIKNLEQALKDKGYKREEIDFEYKSFQLAPDATYVSGQTYKEMLMAKENAKAADVDVMLAQISVMAELAGLPLNNERMKLTDTFPAHRLFQYAKEEGQGYEYFEKLYDAFFVQGALISDADFLISVANELDLDPERAAAIINDPAEYAEEVVREIQSAAGVGAEGVPFFIFNDKYGLSGAQLPEIFEQVLTQIENDFTEE